MGTVITYKNEGEKGVLSQIKLDDGVRVLISIAADEIQIFKLRFGGTIPAGSVWYYPDLLKFVEAINQGQDDPVHPLDILVEKVKTYSSIDEMRRRLNEFVKDF